MPNFAANITMMFNEVQFLDRFQQASQAGFKGVEYLVPYAFEAEEIAEQLHKYKLKQVLFDLPVGDWDGGERGYACHPDRVEEFKEGVELAIKYAGITGCTQLCCLAGKVPVNVSEEETRSTLISNLSYAATKLKDKGISLLLEPINSKVDIPGFYLETSAQALDIIKDVPSDNVFLQYDVYHMQIMEGDLARTMERCLDQIKHIQIADHPGRHEPGTGEINYSFLFDHLDQIGYKNWIGCEYRPIDGTLTGLKWAAPYLETSTQP